MSTLTQVVVLWFCFLGVTLASPARAEEPDPPILPHETASGAVVDAMLHPRAPITLALSAKYGERSTGKHGFGATLSLGFPLGLLTPRVPRAAEAAPSSRAAKEPAAATPSALVATTDDAGGARVADLPIPVVITAAVAREAIAAAVRASRLDASEARLDALLSRARTAALLPTLSLRTTRAIDESQRLSPTLDDPDRVLAAGGSGLWLEARVSWRLDRIMFPTETLAIERLRAARREVKARVGKAVLALLFDYQEARALEADELAEPEAHRKATLRVIEAETSLDLLTAGWFSRWLAVETSGARRAASAP